MAEKKIKIKDEWATFNHLGNHPQILKEQAMQSQTLQ